MLYHFSPYLIPYYNEYSFNRYLAYDLLARGGFGQEVASAALSKSSYQRHLIPLQHPALNCTSSNWLVHTFYHPELHIQSILF